MLTNLIITHVNINKFQFDNFISIYTKVVSRFGPVDKVAQEASMWYNKHEEG